MIRRLTCALAAGAIVVAMVPGAASAGPPIGGCPTGAWWTLIVPIHNPNPTDLNGDRLLCRLYLPNGDGDFTGHDNVVQ